MRCLLDTCAVIFIVENTGDLSPTAETQLKEPDAEVFVSAASIGEVACAQERGRLKLKQHWRVWWNEALRRYGRLVVPIR